MERSPGGAWSRSGPRRWLIPEDEDVEDAQVEGQSQRELRCHHPGEDLVGAPAGDVTVVNSGVCRHGGHGCGRAAPARRKSRSEGGVEEKMKVHSDPVQNPPLKLQNPPVAGIRQTQRVSSERLMPVPELRQHRADVGRGEEAEKKRRYRV